MGKTIFVSKARSVYNQKHNEKKNDCPFCSMEDPLVVYVGKKVQIRMVKYPYADYHVVVIPKRHVKYLFELNEEERNELFYYVSLLTKIVMDLANVDCANVGINMGKLAGGSVEHLHVHVLPRKPGGFLETTCSAVLLSKRLEEMKEEILEKLVEKLEEGKNKK